MPNLACDLDAHRAAARYPSVRTVDFPVWLWQHSTPGEHPEVEWDAARAIDVDEELIEARDREMGNRFTKDAQVTALRGARSYLGDRLIRVATPHRLLDPKAGPLIAVRLRMLTRKTLGGIETDLEGRALRPDGGVIEGLFAAGEASGFGGGGVHGEAPQRGGGRDGGEGAGHAVHSSEKWH